MVHSQTLPGAYSSLCTLGAATPLLRPRWRGLRGEVDQLPPAEAYAWERRFEAWQYGSGLDYVAEEPAPLKPADLERAKKAVEAARARADLIAK